MCCIESWTYSFFHLRATKASTPPSATLNSSLLPIVFSNISTMDFTSKQVSGNTQEPSEKSSNHQPPLNCPRCNSINTKFCYYNNYNKTQPRHFCKSCKRHWTQGGTLRDVPIGGSRRRNKQAKTSNKDNINLDSKSLMDSTPLALPCPNNFHYNPSTSFEDFVSPFSFTDTNQFNLLNSDEMTDHLIQTSVDPSITSCTTREKAIDLSSWSLPSTSSLVGYSNDWSYWDDFNKLTSSTDISQQWDELQLQTEEHHQV